MIRKSGGELIIALLVGILVFSIIPWPIHHDYAQIGKPETTEMNVPIAIGSGFPAGILIYKTSGTISNPKCFTDVTTSSATTGEFSFNMTSAGFNNIYTIQIQAKSYGTKANKVNSVALTNNSMTAVSGTVTSGDTLSLFGSTLTIQPTATTVWLLACGN